MTKQMKIRIAGVIASCVVVIVALASGIGYASGAFNPPPAAEQAEAANPHSESTQVASARQPAEASVETTEEQPADSAQEAQQPAAQATTDEATTEEAVATQSDTPQPSDDQAQAAPEAQPEAPAYVEPIAPEPAQPVVEVPATILVSVSIDSSRAADKGYPSSMGSSQVQLESGASVYDALAAMGVSVGGSSSYVSSIGGLAEFACGQGSGWLYFVNGSSPGIGCGSYTLQDGDAVRWVYTLDMGNDI